MGSHGRRGRDKIRLFGRGVAIAQVDFYVDTRCIAELGLWNPRQEEIRRRGVCGCGRGGGSWTANVEGAGVFLLQEGNVTWYVVLGGRRGMDVDLALREEQLHPAACLGVGDCVVIAFLVVAHGVEAACWRGWSGYGGSRSRIGIGS